MHFFMFLKSRFTIVTIHCILAVRWSRNQLIFTWSTLIGCRNGYLLIGWGSWTELAALQRKLFLVWKCVAMSFFCNTHYGGPVPLLGDEFEFAAAAVAWRGGPNHSLSFINPPPRWMNEWCVRGWFWLVFDGGDDVPQRSHRRKRTKSIEDDEEGHLVYHNGDMLRARCIEHKPFST